MGDLKQELDRWCRENNFKGGETNDRLSKHETGGGDPERTSDNDQQVLQTR